MAVAPETIMTALYVLIAWATVSSIMLILARRDVKLGLKKWALIKFRKHPIKLRYHGPDKSVIEYIVATKGKSETITINDKKMVVFKTQDGSTFFLEENAIRRTDDGVNEISYNYKSIMPLDPESTPVEAEEERLGIIQKIKEQKRERDAEGFQGVEMEALAQYTDPMRLNRLIEYIKLAAKTEALNKSTELEKYVKYALYASLAATAMAGLVWYTMDGTVVPLLKGIDAAVRTVGSSVLNL